MIAVAGLIIVTSFTSLPANISAQIPMILTLDIPAETAFTEGDTIVFTGNLQTGDGVPLEGAVIEVTGYDPSDNPTLLFSAVTDTDGDYQGEWEVEYLADSIEIQAYFEGSAEYQEVYSNSFTIQISEYIPPVVSTVLHLDGVPNLVGVGDVVTFQGYLETEEGVGIYGASINIYAINTDGDGYQLAQAVTGSDGTYQVDWQAQYFESAINVYAYFEGIAGYSASNSGWYEMHVSELQAATALTLDSLPDEVVVGDYVLFSGQIGTEDGQAVVGATVEIYGFDGTANFILAEATSDSNGEYETEWESEFLGDSLQIFAYFAETDDFGESYSGEQTVQFVEASEEIQTQLYLDEPLSSFLVGNTIAFSGYLETSDGQRLAGATIFIYADSSNAQYVLTSDVTDSNGEFEATWSSEYLGDSIAVFAYFAQAGEYMSSQSEDYDIELATTLEDAGTQLIIESDIPSSISEGASLEIEGTLTTTDGDAVPNTPVYIYAYDGTELHLIATASTDGSGNFAAEWEAEYLAYSVQISAYFAGSEGLLASYSESYVVYLLSDQPSSTILYLEAPEYTLTEGQVVEFTGYIADVNYEGIPQATIEIYGYDAYENTFLLATTTSDSSGDFETDWEVEYLADYIGIYAYFAGEDNYEESYSYPHIVEILPEVQTYDVEISMSTEFDLYQNGDTVNVEAMLSDVYEGDVYVEVYNGYGWFYSYGYITPDPDGVFDFYFTIAGEDNAAGTWQIWAYYLGNEQSISFEVEDNELTPENVDQEPFDVDVGGESFTVYAWISSGSIEQISAEPSYTGLLLEVESSFYEGEVIVTLPRDLIDSQDEDGNDLDFLVYGFYEDEWYELSYEEFPSSNDERFLRIFMPPGYTYIAIVGTRLVSIELSAIETTLIFEEPVSEVVAGNIATFTGTLAIADNDQPIESALIWILDYDESGSTETLGWGLTDQDGKFAVEWTATVPEDGDVNAYAVFEGANSIDGNWFESATSRSFPLSIVPSGTTVYPQDGDPYINLYGVWDHDPIRVAVIQYEDVPEEYGEDIDVVFEEWSNLLKRASGNSRAWNFEVVKDSKLGIFDTKPDIIVEIRVTDEDAALKCTEAAGYASPRSVIDVEKRFFDTVPSVVFAACEGELVPHESVRLTAMHELAHAFGLGHTWFKDYDMMCSIEYIDGAWVDTCANIWPQETSPSDLVMDAILYMYGKDGFAEPNLKSIPPFFAGKNIGTFVHLDVRTDKNSYSEGDIARVTVDVLDANGNAVNIKPRIDGSNEEPQQLGIGRYLFDIEVTEENKEFLITAGEAQVILDLDVGGFYFSEGLDLNTSKDSISPGESITISGNIPDATQGTPVTVEIQDANGQTLLVDTVETDGNGNFVYELHVPESAQAGNYIIVASANLARGTVSNNRVVAVAAQQTPTSECLIATAAFGSEIAPQVQFLRDFRDNHILSTSAGSSFMNVFNGWYYSFSPHVADYERGQPWLQHVIRISIYPLLGILTTAEKAYSVLPGEFGSVAAGIVASSLLGAVYASPVALAIRKVRNARPNYVILALIVLVPVGGVAASVIIANDTALMVTSSSLVVLTTAVSAIISANYLSRLLKKMGWTRKH